MSYECVGCGQVERNNPPHDVMPRMILDHWTNCICSVCKTNLEDHLAREYVNWIVERRGRQAHQSVKK